MWNLWLKHPWSDTQVVRVCSSYCCITNHPKTDCLPTTLLLWSRILWVRNSGRAAMRMVSLLPMSWASSGKEGGHLTVGGWKLLRVELARWPGLLITWLAIVVCRLGAWLGLLTRASRRSLTWQSQGVWCSYMEAAFPWSEPPKRTWQTFWT